MRLTVETPYKPNWTIDASREGLGQAMLVLSTTVEIPDLSDAEAPLAYIVQDFFDGPVPLRSHKGEILYHMAGLPGRGDMAEGVRHGWRPGNDLYGKPAFRRDPLLDRARADTERYETVDARTRRRTGGISRLMTDSGNHREAERALKDAFAGVRLIDGSPWHPIPAPVLIVSRGVTMANIELTFSPRPETYHSKHYPIDRYAEAVEALVAAGGKPPAKPLVSAVEPEAPSLGMQP